jgi:uncharacterized lipoprotein YbaY
MRPAPIRPTSRVAIVAVVIATLALAAMPQPSWAQGDRSRDVPANAATTAAYRSPPATVPRPLGIMARNTPTGVDVVSVSNPSVAASAGLKAGDVIVNVAGYQVGFVGDRLYDVGDEVGRRIDTAGQVPLLVRDGRTGGLVQVTARYPANASCTITGVLTADGGVTVPPTAFVTVRILDVTEPQWKDVAITQGALPAGRGFPVTYRLDLPPLPTGHRYAVDARLEDAGRLLMQSPAPVPVPSVDRDHRVDVRLAAQAVPRAAAGTPTPRDQIAQWIQTYLGRPPRANEVDVWLADLQRGRSLGDVQAGILSSTEMFERSRASRDIYVTEVYRLLYGTPPTPVQVQNLQARYDRAQGLRLTFVEQLMRQPPPT